MKMTEIARCSVVNCAYNAEGLCHTPGITVGPHAECNTYVHASGKGGFPEVKGGIGACLASNCTFNKQMECRAPAVDVAIDAKHADCETFKARQ